MAFKMKGFSGFGNSPMKQTTKTALEGLAEVAAVSQHNLGGGGIRILKDGRKLKMTDGIIVYDDSTKQVNKTTKLDKPKIKPKRQPVRNKKIIVTGP